MNFAFGLILGIILTIQMFLFAFCAYWRNNNPWKWFAIKTISTVMVIFYIIHDKEMICGWDMVFCAIIAICIGVDLAYTVINSTNKN